MARRLIEHYHMQKVPQEGCWFSLSYSSDDTLGGDSLPARYAGRAHPAGNAIVALETPRDFSAMHRLQTDEVWHFYDGAPIDMLLLYPDGHGKTITLGSNVLAGELRQFTVPRGVWQGSAPHTRGENAYSFFADQLGPGFDYADFEIGYRDALQRQYPAFARDIERLTRVEFAHSTAPASSLAPPRPPPVEPPPQRDASPAADTPLRAKVFSASDIPALTASPGVTLEELVGEKSPVATTPRLSVAQFTLDPGRSSGTSFNHHSQEVFVVISGTGMVKLQGTPEDGARQAGALHDDPQHAVATQVGPGSTVFIPAMQLHSIEAAPDSSLVFLAISAPAFTPQDYVLVQP
jgi:predicted cupin superfamily sugar epimerase/mannose-6-phosphate isomerase-like protein (cupin superfamily)